MPMQKKREKKHVKIVANTKKRPTFALAKQKQPIKRNGALVQ